MMSLPMKPDTNTPRPDSAPKRDDPPQAEGEKSPFEKMRDLTRRVIKAPKSPHQGKLRKPPEP